MRITIVCDDFTLEDVKALGQYLQDRYKDESRQICVLIDSPKVSAMEAAAALEAIFGNAPHQMQILPFKGDNGGNGK